MVGKALELTGGIATPLATVIPVESIGALAVVEILAVAILVLVCFLAGLSAKTMVAKKLANALARTIHGGFG